jgi:hypothetical protein
VPFGDESEEIEVVYASEIRNLMSLLVQKNNPKFHISKINSLGDIFVAPRGAYRGGYMFNVIYNRILDVASASYAASTAFVRMMRLNTIALVSRKDAT